MLHEFLSLSNSGAVTILLLPSRDCRCGITWSAICIYWGKWGSNGSILKTRPTLDSSVGSLGSVCLSDLASLGG